MAPKAAGIDELVDGVRRIGSRSRRLVAVCSGSFILAAAGLLDGRRVTTHWWMGQELAERHPQIRVDTEPIYLNDEVVWTSAGITACFDLMLAIVGHDLGSLIAREVARVLVMHLRRSGNQSQFAVQLTAQFARRSPVRELQEYITANPTADLSAAALAERMHLSPRHFARVFGAEIGMPPGKYVERVRLEAARDLLEEGTEGLDFVATAAGFGNAQALRRAFVLAYGITPNEYRRRFGRPDLTLVG